MYYYLGLARTVRMKINLDFVEKLLIILIIHDSGARSRRFGRLKLARTRVCCHFMNMPNMQYFAIFQEWGVSGVYYSGLQFCLIYENVYPGK